MVFTVKFFPCWSLFENFHNKVKELRIAYTNTLLKLYKTLTEIQWSLSEVQGFPGDSHDKESACNGRDLCWEDPLEEKMATHSSIPAWRIPWTEEPGGPQSMGSKRVGQNWATAHACIHTHVHTHTLSIITVIQFSSVAQSCPTLSDSMDCGPPGSSVHGIFQARVLEWGAITFYG